MRMSCNGCRVLRKGCSENCNIRPCLQWIKSPDSQANATLFLAKFYGRAGLINLINAGPENLRPAIFRSLLYEACGRIVNPTYGSVGLFWSGNWHLCQAAVESVLKGIPITSEVAATDQGPPVKVYDIRHVSKDEESSASKQRVKSRIRFKRSSAVKPKPEPDMEAVLERAGSEVLNRSASHESSVSHRPDSPNAVEGESKESESMVSVDAAEASTRFEDKPDRAQDGEIGLELSLALEPTSRANHVVPVKKRRIESGRRATPAVAWKTELGLDFPV